MNKSGLFSIPLVGEIIRRVIIKLEGGEQYSESLRYYMESRCNVIVGKYSYGGCFSSKFNVGGKVEIGNYCSFASDIHYYGANHPTSYASTSPFFYNRKFGYDVADVQRNKLHIGNDVWIGYGTTITCGCHEIGNGAVIGAGSVVTHDVPAYSINAGVPAKQLRMRFDEETIKVLEKSEWWMKAPDELIQYYNLISEPKNWGNAIMKG